MPNDQQIAGEAPSTIHHALRSSRRRLIVLILIRQAITTYLNETNSNDPILAPANPQFQTTARELATEVVAVEENIDTSQVSGTEYQNVYASLYQTHLPFLDEIAAIKYDHERKTVEPAANLLGLAITASISSSISEIIFHDSIARSFVAGKYEAKKSTND